MVFHYHVQDVEEEVNYLALVETFKGFICLLEEKK
jgi:hypothetical protein